VHGTLKNITGLVVTSVFPNSCISVRTQCSVEGKVSGFVAVQLSGFVLQQVSGFVAVQLSGFVLQQVSGFVAAVVRMCQELAGGHNTIEKKRNVHSWKKYRTMSSLIFILRATVTVAKKECYLKF
jgi:hypothetical protein